MADDYSVAAEAARKVIQRDIDQEVPVFFLGSLPPDLADRLSKEVAEAVVEALREAKKAKS
jgi:hypothetical protein